MHLSVSVSVFQEIHKVLLHKSLLIIFTLVVFASVVALTNSVAQNNHSKRAKWWEAGYNPYLKIKAHLQKKNVFLFNRLCIYVSCPARISQGATRSSKTSLWHIWNVVLCVLLKDTATQWAQGEGIKPVTTALYHSITVLLSMRDVAVVAMQKVWEQFWSSGFCSRTLQNVDCRGERLNFQLS